MRLCSVYLMCALNSEQDCAPLYDAVKCYARSDVARFHMPGHKGKPISDDAESLASLMWQMDVTELDGTDNLHMPEGAIKKAQSLMAQAYGAKRSFFMVNGATAGIYTMLMAACRPGDTVIIGRNCHKSVINGLVIAGLNPVYVWPDTLEKWHTAGQVETGGIEKALDEHRDAKAVLITSPDYYGLCADVAAIADICHRRGVPLLVDEAHGAHLVFSKALPPDAGSCGADAWVDSMHKTLPSLTQTAVLNVNSDLLDIGEVKSAEQLVQTTSPSYILMASMDIARRYMATNGNCKLSELLGYIDDMVEWAGNIEGLRMMTSDDVVGDCGVAYKDATRVCFDVSARGISGIEAGAIMREHGVQVEMADLYNIVLITTVADDADDFEAVKKAVAMLPKLSNAGLPAFNKVLPHAKQAMSPREAVFAHKEYVPIDRARGRIAAQSIGIYPPGIPLICPGEVISGEITDMLDTILAQGGRVFNIGRDTTITVIN